MDNEELNAKLYEKVQSELLELLTELKHSKPEYIIELAYEFVIKEDIVMSLEENNLSDEKCKALLKESKPLQKIYQKWEKTESDHMYEILNCINNTAKDLSLNSRAYER